MKLLMFDKDKFVGYGLMGSRLEWTAGVSLSGVCFLCVEPIKEHTR